MNAVRIAGTPDSPGLQGKRYAMKYPRLKEQPVITTDSKLTELLDAVEAAGSEYALASERAIYAHGPESAEQMIAAGAAFYGAVWQLRDALAERAATV